MHKFSHTYTLSNENIDLVIAEIEDILHHEKFASRDIIRTRLKAEEVMHFYQVRFGAESTFTFRFVSGLSKRFSFLFEGESEEPFSDQEEDDYIDGFLRTLGKEYDWQYKHHTNIVDFFVPKKPFSQLAQIGIAVACVVLFTLFTRLLDAQTVTLLRDSVLTPLTDTLIAVLRSTAGLFIFISVSLSIVSIGDVHSFRKVSKKLFSRLFLFLFVSTTVSSLAFLPWLNLSGSGGADLAGTATELFATLLDMIPTDPITPFISGNSIQIILLAIFSGVILSILGEKVNTLKQFLLDCNTFFAGSMEKLTGLMPLLVFLVLQNTVLEQNLPKILAYRTLILLWGIGIALQFIIPLLASCFFGRISPADYCRRAKSALLITMLTSSSVAALPYNLELCRREFHIRDSFLKFSVPIVQVLLMPCSAIMMTATCTGVAYLSGMSISPAWVVTALIISIFLSVATPPIPGSMMLIYSLLFTQLNLPMDYMGISITLGILTDCLVTTSNNMSMHALLLWAGERE